jgi:hypothetical protein
MRWVALFLLAMPSSAGAQDFTYRGFSEVRTLVYPQAAPKDDDRLAVEGGLRFEPAYKLSAWLTLTGSFEGRLDNLEQIERKWRLDWRDRGTRRPALAVRQASATLRKGRLFADIGKQFIRWGKADILTPTDRFAPRDFLEVTNGEFLAVTGTRLQYEAGAHLLDVAWVPFFTPSRTPLFDRRWAVTPQIQGPLELVDRGAIFPRRSQVGARWRFIGSDVELSLSYFDGSNHLPEIAAQPLSGVPSILLTRSYAPLKMAGVDGALPLTWFTIKGEAALLTTTSRNTDDVVMYVVQLERVNGELSLVGGYAGELVTTRRSTFGFAPDRGLTRSFLGRADYTIDVNRSVAVEMAIRQNADGFSVKGEYSQARGAHWRVILAATGIGGRANDFFGRYRHNSHGAVTVRYSF